MSYISKNGKKIFVDSNTRQLTNSKIMENSNSITTCFDNPENRNMKRVLCLNERKTGHPTSNVVKIEITNFSESDDFSRICPQMKDSVIARKMERRKKTKMTVTD